ncbi:MAG: hypothetical protein ACFFG0_09505 [Candidatus Thorarchaeota archaeon]
MLTTSEALTFLGFSIPLTAIILRIKQSKNGATKEEISHLKEIHQTDINYITKELEEVKTDVKSVIKDINDIKASIKTLIERSTYQ